MNTFVIAIFVLKITFQSIDCQLVNPTSTILLASTNKRLYNESCNYKDECKVTLNCTNHQCKCLAGWVWSSDDKMCFPFEVGSCNDSIECQDQDKNTMCYKHKCQCQIGFKFDSNRYCTLPNNLIGSQCLTDQQCIVTYQTVYVILINAPARYFTQQQITCQNVKKLNVTMI